MTFSKRIHLRQAYAIVIGGLEDHLWLSPEAFPGLFLVPAGHTRWGMLSLSRG